MHASSDFAGPPVRFWDKSGQIPLLSKLADAGSVISRFYHDCGDAAERARQMLTLDIRSCEIYGTACTAKFGCPTPSEYTRQIFDYGPSETLKARSTPVSLILKAVDWRRNSSAPGNKPPAGECVYRHNRRIAQQTAELSRLPPLSFPPRESDVPQSFSGSPFRWLPRPQ